MPKRFLSLNVLQELKEDNKVLEETKEVLEDQLSGWRARSDMIHQLEKQNLVLKTQIHDMEQVRGDITRSFKSTDESVKSEDLSVEL